MNKTEFIKQIRATAEELKPLTQASSFSGKVWNGKEYVEAIDEKKSDPYALAWWLTLVTMASLIEAQEESLSPKQINYLDRLLFGGMGSLNDLYFDNMIIGANADAVNKRLDEKRHDLFASFKS